MALKSGVDVEAPGPVGFSHLAELVKNHRLDIGYVNRAVGRVLREKFAQGLVDGSRHEAIPRLRSPKAVEIAKQVADESVILLKNNQQLLPIDTGKVHSIAIVGPNANQVEFGDYSASKSNEDGSTVLESVRTIAPHCTIRYAKGCDLVRIDRSGFEEARKAILASDVAVVVIGDTSMVLGGKGDPALKNLATVGEGFDRSELGPPGVQEELVETAIATGKPTIVVMVNGRPYSAPWIKAHANAILLAFYPGQEGGRSIADILFGKVNPSGHLPVTVAQDAGHVPTVYDYKPSGRGYYHDHGSPDHPGRDYVFSSPDALWPFGFGLSYTHFSLSGFKVTTPQVRKNGIVEFGVVVTNDGDRIGKAVVQIYSHQETSSTTSPVKRLRRFAKVQLGAHESKPLHFSMTASEFAIWNQQMKLAVEPSMYRLYAGFDAEDNQHQATFMISDGGRDASHSN